MPATFQARAENDISTLEGEIRDAKSALASAQKPFAEGEKSLREVQASDPEYVALVEAGKKHDELVDQLHRALSVARYGDRDAKSDLIPERGEGVGRKHQGSDRGFKGALARLHDTADDLLRETEDGTGVYEKAAARLRKGTPREAVGSVDIGEIIDADGAKALITRGQGGLDNLVRPDRLPLVDSSPFESYTILDLMATMGTNQNSIEYPTFLGRSGSAAVIADPTSTSTTTGVTTKPDIALTMGLQSERMRTIAAGIPIHRNSLDDIPMIRGMIEQQLPLAVRAELQAQALSGNGSGENFLGLRNRSGIVTVARNSAGSETNVDAIHRTLTQLRLTGDEATAIVLNPLVWEGIRLNKNVQGDYYYGAPAIAGAATLWGKLVITDINVPTTEALVVDWTKVVLMVRSGLSTRASDSHENFFMKNLVQFLCEGRFGLKVDRPSAVGKTTTLN